MILWNLFMDYLIRIIKAILPFIVTLTVICCFHYTNLIFFKFYPPCANLFIFLLFFSSCFREKTVIQKFALAVNPNLSEEEIKYTRKITYVWAGFTFTNFLISIGTVFMSEMVWAIYNGIISYILVGIVFVVEYIVRRSLFKSGIQS